MGRYDEALADFSHAIELGPDRAVAITGRGALYVILGRYLEALADFTRAIELHPNGNGYATQLIKIRKLMDQHDDSLHDQP